MKKMVVILAAFLCNEAIANDVAPKDSRLTTALTSGYVWGSFNRHMINVLTIDGCYHSSQLFDGDPILGIGAKVSYWSWTSPDDDWFDDRITEIPLTAYLRVIVNLANGLRLYGSLGGGFNTRISSRFDGSRYPIGEVEVGLNYSINYRMNFTAASRCLFPHNELDFRVGVAFEI